MDAIYARRMEIWEKHAFVISFATAIKQPICALRPQIHGRSGTSIKDDNFGPRLFRPMRMLNIIMSCGKLREPMHQRENKPRQRPVRIIENNREPWKQRRS